MNKIYLLKLLQQFHEADGIISERTADEEFLQWLKQYQGVLLELKKYYYFLGLDIDDFDSIEIGKGKLDSIVLDKDKCASEFIKPMSEIIIFDNSIIKASSECVRCVNDIDLFFIYNPYDCDQIKKICDIYKLDQFIAISMCGKNFDKDKINKLAIMKKIRDSLGDNILESYEENQDNYFCSLYSKRHIKKLIKTK